MEDIKRELLNKPLTRAISLSREIEVDEAARTIKQISFASDQPIEHWFGKLVLDMSKVRTERINGGAPLLLCHNSYDSDEQVGVVEPNSFTTADGMARADIRFSESAKGEEIFRDVKTGIRRNISVGFFVHSMILESQTDEETIYRADDWEPYEISIVPVPADISVGVGRSKQIERTTEMEKDKVECADEMAETEREEGNEEVTQESKRSLSPVVLRTKELIEFGELFGMKEFARNWAAANPDGTTEGLRRAISDERAATPSAKVPVLAPVASLESVYRGGLKAFKGADAQKRAYQSGMWLRAVLFGDERAERYCRDIGFVTRAHGGTSNELGGVLVPEVFENVMIDLRILYGVFRQNAQVVPMSSDQTTRPRRTSGLTAYFVGDEDSITESSKGWDSVKLTAKELGVLTKYTQNLSDDAVINLADDLASEIAYAMTEKEDRCGFLGDGTSTYGGIVGVIQKLTSATAGLVTGSGNAWPELTLNDHVYVVGKLPQYARKSGNVKWYCSHTYWANVMQKLALAAGGVTHAEIEGELRPIFLGRPVEIVEVMPTAEANSQIPVLYGNLAQAALFGDRRGVTVDTTNAHDTDFAKRLISIRGTERFDINVHSVGDTSNAGPIVGLITASS